MTDLAGRPDAGPPAGQSRWMKLALNQARKAMKAGETPVGAVLVCAGRVLGRGYNRREASADVTQHAELMAIRQASRRLGTWRLDGCDLYVTLEPCIMCAGAIVQARIRTVHYGTADPKAGACGSVVDIFALKQNHPVIVTGGLRAGECSDILKSFFQQRRQQNKAFGTSSERRSRAILNLKNDKQRDTQSDPE